MVWFIGVVTVLGLATGIYSLVQTRKVEGAAEIALAALCPIITVLFGSLQDDRVFGGTKWEFFVHSATVDGDIWPWILFVFLIAEIVCIVRTICVISKKAN